VVVTVVVVVVGVIVVVVVVVVVTATLQQHPRLQLPVHVPLNPTHSETPEQKVPVGHSEEDKTVSYCCRFW
jgi:hypothetical protein